MQVQAVFAPGSRMIRQLGRARKSALNAGKQDESFMSARPTPGRPRPTY